MLKDGYQIDHIVPLSKGGSNWPRNIQLTCRFCNHSKRAHDPVDFSRKLGALL
jgi:5-methylcytosine-specific restriction endonuclease McrA